MTNTKIAILITCCLAFFGCTTMPSLKDRQTFISENPKTRFKDQILNQQLAIGMTKEEVKSSWGLPQNINSTVGRYTNSEQWVYGDFPSLTYIYFEGDILTTFQQSH